jgi:hypothetical protein
MMYSDRSNFDWSTEFCQNPNKSAPTNSADLMRSRRAIIDNGVPVDARLRVEEMIIQVRKGNLDPEILHKELEAWQLFDEYQDQFFQALKGRRLNF